MANADELQAFVDLVTDRKYSPLDEASCTAFRAANGASICQAVTGVTDRLPEAAALALFGNHRYGDFNRGTVNSDQWIPEAKPAPCSYGFAAKTLADRMGVR